MLQTRVIPCLLIQDGRLIKTVKFRNPAYVGDPINAIKIYNEKEVDELILLDITATCERRNPPFQLLAKIASECFMPLAYGGGIKSMGDIKKIFNLGVEKVAINSFAIENPSFISEAAKYFGSQSIIAALDVKKTLLGKYILHTHGGRKATGIDAVKFAKQAEELGAGEILLNSMDRDGTWEGYDLHLLKMVTDKVNIPVIACGGAGKIEHFVQAVREGGASAVAAGSMVVYQKKDLGVLINFPSREQLQAVFLD